jgi:DNA-binding response OmpR family regulator
MTLLVVIHDDRFREHLARMLRDVGFEVIELSDGIEALSYMASCDVYPDVLPWPDLIIAEMEMPAFGGLDLLTGLGEGEMNPPVILINPGDDEDLRREAYRLGSWLVLERLSGAEDICSIVSKLIFEEQLPGLERSSTTINIEEPLLSR